ncbi:tyrosine-type recombinase/integrase [Akkermansiaceae bacterium]|nr:tyrosine-type recombinase/integrase [Akkermansiaceae bacterium]
MAFLFKRTRSQYWHAGWKDRSGKRVNRSTKIQAKANLKREAQRIADQYEDASRRHRTARQVRQVITELHQQITGEELQAKSVRSYVEIFLLTKSGETSTATLRAYRTNLGDFLSWLGDRDQEDLNDIRQTDISTYRNFLLAKVASTTATNKIKSIRAMFAAAVKEGFCAQDPTANLKLQKRTAPGTSKERRVFTLEELKIIREASSPEWESMLLFGLYTGQRLGDLAMLRWSNIDLQREELRIETRKTGRRQVIPLAAPLLEYLLNTAITSDEPDAFIHANLAPAYEKSSATVSNQFTSLLANCGLRQSAKHQSKGKGRGVRREASTLSFHSLRATAVTMLHEAGIPAATVEEWVGHDSAEVHRAYVKIGRDSLKKASSALPEI